MNKLFHDVRAAAIFDARKMNKVNLFESANMFCDVYCLQPGQGQKDHAHASEDKIYYALTGQCHVRIGDEERVLKTGELAIAPAGVIHGVHNNSESATTLLVFMAPHPRLRHG